MTICGQSTQINGFICICDKYKDHGADHKTTIDIENVSMVIYWHIKMPNGTLR